MSRYNRSCKQYCIAGKVPSCKRIPILAPPSRCWLQVKEREERTLVKCVKVSTTAVQPHIENVFENL
jgi:hypothetical protein